MSTEQNPTSQSEFVIPIAIAAAVGYYLIEIVALGSSYNELFVIPVAILVIAACLFECVFVLLRRRHAVAAPRRGQLLQRLIVAPEIRFAALVIAFLALFEHLPFLMLSFAFMMIAPHFFARGQSRSVGWIVWGATSLVIVAGTYALFKYVLGASLI